MSNMSNAARDAMKDAKDAAKEASKVASDGVTDIQTDLENLREDVARLTRQLGNVLAAKGNVAWRHAKKNVEGAGMEALEAVRDVGDNVVDAIDDSLKRRPYTTLAIAVGIGFLFGATWRR